MSQEKEIMVIDEVLNNKNIVTNIICCHEWTTDYIDISPELSQKICYCVKCEVTKEDN